MICETTTTGCVLNKSKTLQSIAKKVRECEFSGITEGQFAAVDAFIASVDLPYIDSNGMMSAPCDEFRACEDTNVSLVSTLISLISSYREVRNVIVFDDDTGIARCIVNTVDMVRTKGNAGITCTVSVTENNGHDYIVNVSTISSPITVKQPELTDVLKVIMDVDYSLTWISSPRSIELAIAMQRKPTNMWVNNTGTATDTVSLTGSYGTRILPMMYTLPTTNNAVSVNFGSPLPSLAPRVQDTRMRLNTVVSQIINAGTKNHKCYYCSFMETVHDRICSCNGTANNTYQFDFGDIINDILTE